MKYFVGAMWAIIYCNRLGIKRWCELMPEEVKRGRGRPKGTTNAVIMARAKTKRSYAKRVTPLTDEELKRTPIADVRQAYSKLAHDYRKLMDRDLVYCAACDDFHPAASFYEDDRFGCRVYPQCKESLKYEAMDYDERTDTFIDNKEKTIEVFRKLDIPFVETIYDNALTKITEGTSKSIRGKTSAYQHTLTTVKSLAPYSAMTFAQSQYDDTAIYEAEDHREARPEIKKIFGDGFTESDYIYLQDQYDDWYARTQVDTKAQEMIIIQLCFNQLNTWKAQKMGKDTKDLIKSFNDLMSSGNLQPRQNAGNASGDTLTYGQQIEKLEMTRPVSEPSEEFKDVDGIMKYISTWFLGHIAKAFGLKNVYSQTYEEEVKRYTVEPPKADEEGESKEIRQRLFGKDGD